MIKKSVKIDLLGLKCPLPVLKANKLIKEHKKGEIIELLVDDIAAPMISRYIVKQKITN